MQLKQRDDRTRFGVIYDILELQQHRKSVPELVQMFPPHTYVYFARKSDEPHALPNALIDRNVTRGSRLGIVLHSDRLKEVLEWR